MDPLSDLFTDQAAAALLADTPSPADDWWVSKTDIRNVDRCPWAFSAMERGEVTRGELLGVRSLARFMADGMKLESEVRSQAIQIPSDVVPTMSSHRVDLILGVPLIRRADLGIHGRPDGVAVGNGTFIPVEVKSHQRKRKMDEIELCFYWELLAPWRDLAARTAPREGLPTVIQLPPMGYLILRDKANGWRMEAVPLEEERFVQMRSLVADVRTVRATPPKARVCDCVVCSRLRRQQVVGEARSTNDLTRIKGIKRRRAVALEQVGIGDVAELRYQKPERVMQLLKEAGLRLGASVSEIERWIHHAEALESQRAVIFGTDKIALRDFIAVDFEYDSDPDELPSISSAPRP